MINEIELGQHEATEILHDLADRTKLFFEDLTFEEKIALNQKELIEDDYFIVLSHRFGDVRKYINELTPLNFFINDACELIAYCEDDEHFWRKLPEDTTLKFNRI